MANPLISIIIPVYNVNIYLSQCLNSVIRQTYTNIEIILVDDNSTDNSLEICYEYKEQDARIIVVHKELNCGLGHARNTGLGYATGKYVTFLDSDDWISDTHIEVLFHYMTSYSLDMVIGSNTRCNCNGKRIKITNLPFYGVFVGDRIKEKVMLNMISPEDNSKSDLGIPMSVCFSLYDLELIREKQILFISERTCLSEDLFFNLHYLSHIKKVKLIKEFGYYYRSNFNSISTGFDMNQFERLLYFYNYLKDTVDKLNLEDFIGYRVERSVIAKLRAIIMMIVRSKFSHIIKISYINKILKNETIEYILGSYPIQNYRISLRLVVYFMRKKYAVLSYIAFYAKEKQRKYILR